MANELLQYGKGAVRAPQTTGVDPSRELLGMSDIEDYPGPTHDHPEKKGRPEQGRADENMVKPPARPKNVPIDPKKKKELKGQGRGQGSLTR